MSTGGWCGISVRWGGAPRKLVSASVAVWALVFVADAPVSAQWETLSGRFTLQINAAWQSSSQELRQTFTEPVYGETARFEAVHDIKGGAMIDGGGSLRVWRELSIGAIYTELNQADSTTVTGTVPHPILFNTDRAIDPELFSLTHRERTTHIFAAWRVPIPQVEGLDVSVYGGPSYINLTQGTITGVGVAESGGPPFSSVTVTDVPIAEYTRNGWGGHIGVNVTYMVTSVFGVGGFVRFSNGTIELPSPEDSTVPTTVGGLQTGGGIRLRF